MRGSRGAATRSELEKAETAQDKDGRSDNAEAVTASKNFPSAQRPQDRSLDSLRKPGDHGTGSAKSWRAPRSVDQGLDFVAKMDPSSLTDRVEA